MLKEILKYCSRLNIKYTNGYFIFNDIKVHYHKFILFVMKEKFYLGLEKSVELAKSELFIEKDSYKKFSSEILE